MTQMHERTSLSGDTAFEIFDDSRDQLSDRFAVESLEVEFPYFDSELRREFGARGLYLARADDNEAGTFKTRGAYVGAYELQQAGVDRMQLFSAGNFAAGAAIAGRLLDLTTTIGVPESAPYEKREGLYRFWDSPKLRIYPVGATLEDTRIWMAEHPEFGEQLHPFDDFAVIKGQGTIADDLLAALPEVQRVVVPVGGGGLLAGLRQRFDELDREDITLHAVEATGSNSLSQSLHTGEQADADAPNKRYGGSAVQTVGDKALRICMAAGSRVMISNISDDSVDVLMGQYQQSRRDLWRQSTSAYEPTTLVAVAGLTEIVRHHPHDVIAVVGTGHNAPLPEYI